MEAGSRLGLASGLILAALGAVSVPRVEAQPVTVSAGVTVRAIAGTFGSDRTTTGVYVPATVRAEVGRFETSWSLPYLGIMDGTAVPSTGGAIPMQGSLPGAPATGMSMGEGGSGGMMSGGAMMSGATGSGTVPGSAPPLMLTNQAGVGDIVGAVGYRVVDRVLTGLQVVVGTRLKFPVASAAKGLGTGRMDVGASATVRRRFARGWAFAEGGYLHVGSPEGVDLRGAAFWNVGAGRELSGPVSLLASVTGNTAIVPDFAPPLELSAGVGLNTGHHYTLSVMPAIGLTEASPNIGLVIGFSRRVFER